MDRLPEPIWRERLACHVERLAPFADERLARMSRREKHPIRDFLFQYYSFRPAHLLRWSPGPDVLLENAQPADISWKEFQRTDGGILLPADTFPAHRLSFVRWAHRYLEAISQRPPVYGCFGLHEWAMVYHTPDIRHERTPLRLAPQAIAAVVEPRSCAARTSTRSASSLQTRPRGIDMSSPAK